MLRYRKTNLTVGALLALLAVSPRLGSAAAARATACTRIWDTGAPSGDETNVRNRTGWKLVPCDLISLEANPSGATADPAYYGREYSFEGDAAVENEHYLVVFNATRGSMIVYSKAGSGKKCFELLPLGTKAETRRISSCTILRNTGNEAALEITFSAGAPSGPVSAMVSFDKTEVVGVTPNEKMGGITLVSPIEYGVVPDFVGDDLIFPAQEHRSVGVLSIPSESMFLGLLEGGDQVLVSTWPQGKQQMELRLAESQARRRVIETVDFRTDGRSVYLAVLSAPGIWHREVLKPNYLEKDVSIEWQRPFPAKWTMQLDEARIKTTFTLRDSKVKIWRGVTGHYTYPVWFEGNTANFRLSKKIPPKGEAVIYFVEGKDTPRSITTPVDILKATLGRGASETILDFPGRVLRTHHRRGSVGIRRACTCGGTEAIEAVFKAGQEVQRREYVDGAVDDMIYFVTRHVERIDEYRRFADEILKFIIATGRSAPGLKAYLDEVEAIAREIPQVYDRHKENMKTLAYADELARKTKALAATRKSGNLQACLELCKQWRAMGGAQDNVIALYHSLTRKLAQEAGYGCADRPEAVEVAKEIRRRCRQCLRNADGYEIWPNY